MDPPIANHEAAARDLVQSIVDRELHARSAVEVALGDDSDRELRSKVLDGLATASSESTPALETLLLAVHQNHLAKPSIRRLVVDHHEIEEIEQDVLIAVARSVKNFRSEARFTTWLHAVARNVTIDHLRRQRNHAELPAEQVASDAVRLSSMIATSKTIRDAVDQLDDDYRIIVTLRDIEQLSYQEIADRLELNLNTAKSKIYRGRALLAGLIDGSDG